MSSEQQALERTAHHGRTMVLSMRPVWSTEMVLYFGDWEVERDESDGLDWVGNPEGRSHRSNTQFSAFEFSFRGSTVRWLGTRGPDHGFADVYLDGLFQETVDNYAETRQEDLVKFEKTGIEGDRVHTLRVVVRKDRNPPCHRLLPGCHRYRGGTTGELPSRDQSRHAGRVCPDEDGNKTVPPPRRVVARTERRRRAPNGG